MILMAGLYLFYSLGMIWTSDRVAGGQAIETMFSLLLFPILFSFSTEFFRKQTLNILLFFILGCFIASLSCIFVAFWESISIEAGRLVFNPIDQVYAGWEYGGSHFKYTNLSLVLHPTYFSCYLLFSVICCIQILRNGTLTDKRIIYGLYLSIPFFLVMIYLLSSKSGIICAILCVIFYTGTLARRQKILRSKVLVLLSGFVLVFLALQNPRFFSITEAIKNPERVSDFSENGSVISRVHIWRAGVEIIEKNFLTGVGTGDSNAELVKQYEIYHLSDPLRLKANAHNQYFETFIDLGIGGFLLLLSLFIYPAIKALTRKNILFLSFLFILSFNFLFETMLNKMSAAIFLGFFYCLLSNLDEANYLRPQKEFR